MAFREKITKIIIKDLKIATYFLETDLKNFQKNKGLQIFQILTTVF